MSTYALMTTQEYLKDQLTECGIKKKKRDHYKLICQAIKDGKAIHMDHLKVGYIKKMVTKHLTSATPSYILHPTIITAWINNF